MNTVFCRLKPIPLALLLSEAQVHKLLSSAALWLHSLLMNDIVMYMYFLLKKRKKKNMCQDGRTNSYYRNDPKFSDRQVRANGADQHLDCLPFRLHLLNALLYGKAALFKF